ncbi:MAG: hypothetical protein HP490_01855 [Nitrospira sp.]|nr:hypothetical protein [Nitrospira sp.]
MSMSVFRWSVLSLVGLVMCSMTACTRWIDVKSPSSSSQETISHALSSNERVPLVMDTFRMSQNGTPQHPSSEAERRVLNAVQETHLFSTLVPLGGASTSTEGKAVTARITLDETIDSHSGPTALKGIVIGASMFAHLELERWDGHVTHYDARSSGTAHYNLFGASPVIINELKGQVIETCLNSLMNQLVQDTPLYMASKTPLPASTIHTVTVKARRPAPLQGALPAIPVSENPAP